MKLKFRVWEGEKYLSLSKALKQGLVGVQYDRDDSFELESYYEHVAIEMFTGLKDKNGVEIFEGDVVRLCAGEYCYGVWEYDSTFEVSDIRSIGLDFANYEEIYIVDNIHEVQK